MKILEINTERSWRGGERQTCYNVKGLKALGNTVELMCRKGFPLSIKALQEGCILHEVKGAPDAISFLIRKGRSYDVIHTQTAKAQFYAVVTKLFHGRPVVYSRRVDFVPKGALTKLKYNLTDRTVAISEAIRSILTEFGLKNVAVISDAVEPLELNKERAKKIISEQGFVNKKIIATTAAFVQHKDPLTMVRAISELSKKRSDFVFLHFGEGILKEKVQAEIEAQGLKQHYKIMGFIENVEDLFAVFDVFVMSSEEEGLGSSVLDAFVYNVPVATTDAGGLKELAQHRGLICKVKDHVKLAGNINELLDDQELKRHLVGKAYHYALKEHSVEKIANEYHTLFLSLR